MKDYFQVTFSGIDTARQEMLIAHLSEAAYEGFEQTDDEMKAFIPQDNFNETVLGELAAAYQLSFDLQLIKAQNWNAHWESNFQPVIVDDFVGVRADFHETIAGVKHEIVITPKMSFGTGHHATTFLMIQQMREIDFVGKTVFDFGTGTGILAILAEKLGAKKIVAVDNDDWSITNASENLEKNNCANVVLKKAGRVVPDEQYDIILANINRNVIVENFPSLATQLAPRGILLISGLLEENETELISLANTNQMTCNSKAAKDNWIALRVIH